jgi:alpha-acetolactate decarboxylase
MGIGEGVAQISQAFQQGDAGVGKLLHIEKEVNQLTASNSHAGSEPVFLRNLASDKIEFGALQTHLQINQIGCIL